MERRLFLEGALALTGIPPLCCISPTIPPAAISIQPETLSVDLNLVPALRRPGAAFSLVDEPHKLNLLLIHVDKDQYVAMNRSCTHGGAQCTYNPKRRRVRCTSLNHAEYDLAGTLLHGRTHGNLQTYEVTATRSTITVKWQAHT
jgi:Rieske Fe-S protein